MTSSSRAATPCSSTRYPWRDGLPHSSGRRERRAFPRSTPTTTSAGGRPISRVSFAAVLASACAAVPWRALAPDHDRDYFVLKPKHSAFFATPLETLLTYLGAKTLILTGLTGDMCVLLTAGDAFLRDFHLVVPSDCLASIDPMENRRALAYMKRVFDADVRASGTVDFAHLARLRAA